MLPLGAVAHYGIDIEFKCRVGGREKRACVGWTSPQVIWIHHGEINSMGFYSTRILMFRPGLHGTDLILVLCFLLT